MRVEIGSFLGSIEPINGPGCRLSSPDDPTFVSISNPTRLSACLTNALIAFRESRQATGFVTYAGINDYHKQVLIRFVVQGARRLRRLDPKGLIETSLRPVFRLLGAAMESERGEFSYWGSDNHFNLSFPYRGPMRESFPDVDHLPWDNRYQALLNRASWESLRRMVYRYSSLASSIAAECKRIGLTTVLLPSVGLTIHPWLFANSGLNVIATDIAATPLSVLASIAPWHRLFSTSAFERWDLSQCSSYATQGNLDHFEGMPVLENKSVRAALQRRISLVVADWAALPLRDYSIDAIFAANSLPRGSPEEQTNAILEWTRIVKPGGLVFVVQHNFSNSIVDSLLHGAGWRSADVLAGERPTQSDVTTFQTYYASG